MGGGGGRFLKGERERAFHWRPRVDQLSEIEYSRVRGFTTSCGDADSTTLCLVTAEKLEEKKLYEPLRPARDTRGIERFCGQDEP